MHIDHWSIFFKNNFGRIGILLIASIALFAVLAPLISDYAPGEYTGKLLAPPSMENLLGTNDVGQDVLMRLLYGARTSLIVGISSALLSVFLSVLFGGAAAMLGGIFDRVCMRFVDAMLVLPSFIIIILFSAYLRPGMLFLIVLLSSFMWPGGARIVRSQALSFKQRVHVSASRAFGAGSGHVMSKHIIPEMGPLLIAVAIQDARRAVFMEAGLSFFGVSDPAVISWGKMMQQAMKFICLDAWMWWLLPAGIALTLVVMSLTFVGYAVESALDPRLK